MGEDLLVPPIHHCPGPAFPNMGFYKANLQPQAFKGGMEYQAGRVKSQFLLQLTVVEVFLISDNTS